MRSDNRLERHGRRSNLQNSHELRAEAFYSQCPTARLAIWDAKDLREHAETAGLALPSDRPLNAQDYHDAFGRWPQDIEPAPKFSQERIHDRRAA